MVKINLLKIEDGLDTHWWHYIRAEDFAFMDQIPNQSALEVEEDDVLVHKKIFEGERFPTKKYHIILDGAAYEMSGDDIRENMAEKLGLYLRKFQKYPFGCEFKKIQKSDNNAVINYNPNNFDNFQIKIDPIDLNLESEDFLSYFQNLPKEMNNPLQTTDSPTFTIEPISEQPVIQTVAAEGGGKVFITKGTIEAIDLRKSFFQGSETIFYLLRIKGGKAAPIADKKKLQAMKREFDYINIKSSEKAMEKYDLKVGDVISFNGQFKVDSKLKALIQNIRKFEKQEKMVK